MNLTQVCKVCLGYLLDHPSLIGWWKCVTCGYCEKNRKSMITIQELNPKNYKLTEEQEENIKILHEKINKVRQLYGKPMIVTSGVRDIEHHKRIYRDKGITDESKIPMRSKHLFAQAVDIKDSNGELAKWCKENEDKLKEIGLWMESLDHTKGWCHFQSVPYGSYKEGKSIFFIP